MTHYPQPTTTDDAGVGTDARNATPGEHPQDSTDPLTDQRSEMENLPLHIHPSQRSRAGTIRAARVRWCDDGGEPEPMIRILIRNRPIQTLTYDQALGLAHQIADLIQKEMEEKANGKSE